jgi:copper chaperone
MVLHYQVPDMSCDHCVKAITKAVLHVEPGAVVQADLPNHRVQVTGTDARLKVENAIRDAGYSPTAV